MKMNTFTDTGKTNPIQTQSNPICLKAKMNVSSVLTKGYENKPRLRVSGKQSQFEAKTNPIKPKTPPARRRVLIKNRRLFYVIYDGRIIP